MYVAMNNFKVVEGKEEEFERIGKERESYLGDVPGFLHFALLKADAQGEYISHSTWESRDAFQNLRDSEAFRRLHSGGQLEGAVAGRPQLTVAEVVYSEGSLTPNSG